MATLPTPPMEFTALPAHSEGMWEWKMRAHTLDSTHDAGRPLLHVPRRLQGRLRLIEVLPRPLPVLRCGGNSHASVPVLCTRAHLLPSARRCSSKRSSVHHRHRCNTPQGTSATARARESDSAPRTMRRTRRSPMPCGISVAVSVSSRPCTDLCRSCGGGNSAGCSRGWASMQRTEAHTLAAGTMTPYAGVESHSTRLLRRPTCESHSPIWEPRCASLATPRDHKTTITRATLRNNGRHNGCKKDGCRLAPSMTVLSASMSGEALAYFPFVCRVPTTRCNTKGGASRERSDNDPWQHHQRFTESFHKRVVPGNRRAATANVGAAAKVAAVRADVSAAAAVRGAPLEFSATRETSRATRNRRGTPLI